MDVFDVEENFYGVYLLKSLNQNYRGSTYIGFTVNPNRRIKQHNRGKEYGGAWRTSKRGPWEMILTVHGFPSDVSALRFEWAWQHPTKSRRLKSIISRKKSTETRLDFNIRIMFTMLSTPPWNRLPLTVRWLSADVFESPPNLTPPIHMPIRYGPVVSKKVAATKKNDDSSENLKQSAFKRCKICRISDDEGNILCCLNTTCESSWHLFCIANKFLDEELAHSSNNTCQRNENRRQHILPVEGSCPDCKSFLLWGDLISKKKKI